jgi:hypothetical protein
VLKWHITLRFFLLEASIRENGAQNGILPKVFSMTSSSVNQHIDSGGIERKIEDLDINEF